MAVILCLQNKARGDCDDWILFIRLNFLHGMQGRQDRDDKAGSKSRKFVISSAAAGISSSLPPVHRVGGASRWSWGWFLPARYWYARSSCGIG